jgi:hypothetical protein
MNQKIATLLSAMDQKTWCRMLVCYTPTLVLGKLASQFGQPALGYAATGFLVIGTAVFLTWSRIRGIKNEPVGAGEQFETETAVSVSTPARPLEETGREAAKGMAELVQACDGSSVRAIELIELELDLDSSLSYAGAIHRALKRHAYVK